MSVNVEGNPTSRERTLYIQHAVKKAGAALRHKYPVLEKQSAIGLSILVFSLGGMIIVGGLYVSHLIPWWACVLINAFLASLTHELEHDLIHSLYFRKNRVTHNVMLGLTWAARPTTINPWVRRQLHFTHHKLSGTPADLEERTLSNGTPWSVLRFLMLCDLMFSTSVMVSREPGWAAKFNLLRQGAKAYLPVTALTWALWHLFIAYHVIDYLTGASSRYAAAHEMTGVITALDAVVVILIAPNVLRSFCLHFITSNIHYYGDVDSENFITQTQVLNSRWFWPFQLFCFNFGATHGIHHFVVNEPFYIRQLTARHAHQAMREMGVRFNDMGSFKRANRWTPVEKLTCPERPVYPTESLPAAPVESSGQCG